MEFDDLLPRSQEAAIGPYRAPGYCSADPISKVALQYIRLYLACNILHLGVSTKFLISFTYLMLATWSFILLDFATLECLC
jgi:hypothetical protein